MTNIEMLLLMRGVTIRQAKTANLVCAGLTNRVIGQRLFISEKCVKDHLTQVYKKIGVKSRLELVVFCFNEVAKKPIDKADVIPELRAGKAT
jgi:two-component system response regulator DegU